MQKFPRAFIHYSVNEKGGRRTWKRTGKSIIL